MIHTFLLQGLYNSQVSDQTSAGPSQLVKPLYTYREDLRPEQPIEFCQSSLLERLVTNATFHNNGTADPSAGGRPVSVYISSTSSRDPLSLTGRGSKHNRVVTRWF